MAPASHRLTEGSTICNRRAFKEKKGGVFNDCVCMFMRGRAWPSMSVEVMRGSLSGIKRRVQQAPVITETSCLPEKDVNG